VSEERAEAPVAAAPATALVVGSGLIGTSLGLALRRAGTTVHLVDRDPAVAQRAAELGAGTTDAPRGPVELAVVAAPPGATAAELARLVVGGAAEVVLDVAGAKSAVVAELERLGVPGETVVLTHPMAGREQSGPGAARADLFEGRPWVLVPLGATSPAALQAARQLVAACGGVATEMSAAEHDRAVALVSHVPQLAASLVAARLVDGADPELALSGQGVRDVTRVAASDPALWAEVVAHNSGPVLAQLEALQADLAALTEHVRALSGGDRAAAEGVAELVRRGNQGHGRIPGKHGGAPADYAVLPVVVADRPGGLAALFADCGTSGVNVEDVAIEHSAGQPVGLVQLSVRPQDAERLAAALTAAGWSVHA
jgi:prephenate dehydrogenase